MQSDPLTQKVVKRYLEASGEPYAALFLDAASQRRLLSWWKTVVWIPLHAEVKAHHMTIKFNPSPEEMGDVPIGIKGIVQVVGYAADDTGQAVMVRPSVRSLNRFPHITVAVVPGVSAVYSNELLAKDVKFVTGPRLTGIVDIRTD